MVGLLKYKKKQQNEMMINEEDLFWA